MKIEINGENLTQSVTVSTKISKQLKEKMQHYKIKPSKILRKAIEDIAKSIRETGTADNRPL